MTQSQARFCPNCGAVLMPSAFAHCPRCLLELGFKPVENGPETTVKRLDSPLLPGLEKQRKFGNYEIMEELGRGGMGVVFKARHRTLDRVVALKIVARGEFASEAELSRFHREAEAAASLDHPNIVPVYEFGEQDGCQFYSMRLMAGGNLAGALRRSEVRSRKSAARCIARIARAVQYAHERGILHRDLKPGNILLDSQAEPHVGDFGLAKRLGVEDHLTLSGVVLGTPSYLSPEQAAGDQSITTASDVYSLGAILYELLSGETVFQGTTPIETLAKVKEETPRSLRSLDSAIDPDLQTICLKCLEKSPSLRYPCAAALADDLERWLAGEPIEARPVGAVERTWRWCRRKPLIAGLTASVGLLLFAIAIGSPIALYRISREQRATRRQEILARQHAYASDMLVASSAVRDRLFGRAQELLKRYEQPTGRDDLRGVEWHFLQALTRGPAMAPVWKGPNPIKYFAMAGPDRWLVQDASGSNRWVTPNGPPLPALLPDSYRSRLSPSGHFLVWQGFTEAKYLEVWDTVRNVPLFTVKPTWMQTWLRGERVAFSPDESRLYVGQNDGQVSVWNLKTHAEIGERFPAFTNLVKGVAPSARGDWRAQIGGVAVSPDGIWLAVSDGMESHLAIWNIPTHQKSNAVTFEDLSPAYTVLFSPNGKTITTAHLNGELVVWNAVGLKRIAVLRTNGAFCDALRFSPDGQWLAAGDGLLVRVWATAGWTVQGALSGHLDHITSLAFEDNGKLISASQDGSLKRWAIPPRKTSTDVQLTIPFAEVASWSTSKRSLLTADLAGDTLRVWDLDSLKMTGEQHLELAAAGCAAVTDDGRCFAIGYDDGSISLHRVPFDSVQRRPVHAKDVLQLTFSTTGAWLASASDDTLRLHQVVVTGLVEVASAPISLRHGSDLAFSPDAQLLATIDYSVGKLEVFLVPTLHPLWITSLPSAGGGDVTFSPDGKWLAAGTHRGALRVWETKRFEPIATLDPYNLGIDSLTFSPDGQRLAAQIGRVRCLLWDTATWRELGDFDLPRAAHGMAFTPDGTALILADLHRIIVWPAADSL